VTTTLKDGVRGAAIGLQYKKEQLITSALLTSPFKVGLWRSLFIRTLVLLGVGNVLIGREVTIC